MQAQLDDWITQEDGSYLVTASLLTYSDAEGSSNRTFRFILNDNGYKDELPDPLFYYTISNVSPMDDSFSDLTQEKLPRTRAFDPKRFRIESMAASSCFCLLAEGIWVQLFLLPSGSGLPEAVPSVEIMADADESAA